MTCLLTNTVSPDKPYSICKSLVDPGDFSFYFGNIVSSLKRRGQSSCCLKKKRVASTVSVCGYIQHYEITF